ncbi:MAG: M28 family peptidase [Halobacteriales archaeon]|nr:M28 family peptidase [Halobacteriales archaeon]
MSIDDYELYELEEPNLSGLERELYDAINEEEPWALIEEFAGLIRESGSDDEAKAATYITDRLDALSVPYDRYDPELWLSHPRDASLTVEEPTTTSFDAVKTVAFSGQGEVSGDVVEIDPPDRSGAGGALTASLGELTADVSDNIVLVEADYLSRQMILQLEAEGAQAVIGVQGHPDEPHEGIASPIWGGAPEPHETDRVPEIIITNVARSVGEELFEFAASDEPFHATVSATAPRDWYDCPVVVARIPGEADPDDDDFVLLHGHYDSWHYGVTDNATGDAGLLELARVFNEHREALKRDLWVAWWPAHSTGRYAGSTWFVDEFALELEANCVAHVNMDSPGVADATEFVEGVQWMPEAHQLCQSAIADTCGKESNEHRVARAGDYSFNNLGITGMFMGSSAIPMEVRKARGWHIVSGSGGHANAWHLSTDTIEKADPDVLVRDMRMYATVVARLTAEEILPLDHRHTVETHLSTIDEYATACEDHFDLEPVRSELNRLETVVEHLYRGIETGDIAAATANDAIKELSRTLVRLDHTERGRFKQDPAMGRPPYTKLAGVTDLPSLEGDDYEFMQVQLKRARNTVVHDLRRLIDRLEAQIGA